MGKTGTIERFYLEEFGEMGYFGIAYPEAYGGLNLDLFYTVIFLKSFKKIIWFCSCDVGTFLFSNDPFECRRR
jgi:alkylation response protein AidB-like acyl-CoA dehydrogenase